jgi:zinc protease
MENTSRNAASAEVCEGRMTLSATPAAAIADALDKGPDIVEEKLDNGMTVIVIPDHRAPVVTHMVWYRNGSADDPPGKSGIAHFLEHLMFKGTHKHPKGAFSEAVAEIGGQENAFTGNDYTAYFQRVAKEHLGLMMSYEADRMTGLTLTDDVVAPERDVVMEERRMHCDADPSAQLNEAMQAAVFTHHPYGKPIIGWGHEIESLGREDALAYYGRFYTPENAILIVAGDVEPAEGLRLAQEHYGPIRPRGQAPERKRPREPKPVAKRRVEVTDEKVEQPSWQRVYLCPSHATAAPGESEALEVLSHLIGGGPTSFLYRRLVVEGRRAVAAGAYYAGSALDDTRFILYGMPAPGVSLADLDADFDAALDAFLTEGVSAEELERGKTRLIAEAVYAQDSQVALARWYGASLATGQSIADVQGWPARIEAVTAEAVVAAAKTWLDRRRAVTGYLTNPEQQAA